MTIGSWHYQVESKNAKEIILWLKDNYGPSYNAHCNQKRATYRNRNKTCIWAVTSLHKQTGWFPNGRPIVRIHVAFYFYKREAKVHFKLVWAGVVKECLR